MGRPILTFFTNREIDEVTLDKTDPVQQLLKDMGYTEGVRSVWYLDRDEYVCFSEKYLVRRQC